MREGETGDEDRLGYGGEVKVKKASGWGVVGEGERGWGIVPKGEGG